MFGVKRYGAAYVLGRSEYAIVDPGTSHCVPAIIGWFESRSVPLSNLKYILLTHIHMDHAGSTGQLLSKFPRAEVIVHKKGAKHLVDPDRLVKSVERATRDRFAQYGEMIPSSEERVSPVSDKTSIFLAEREIIIFPTPGHAPHHICFLDSETQSLFTGDGAGLFLDETLVPSTPPPTFNLEQSIESLKKMMSYKPQLLLFPHFGPAKEPQKVLKRYRKLIREWVELVKQAVQKSGEEAAMEKIVRDKSHWIDEKFTRGELEMNVRGTLRYLKWVGAL